MPPSGHPLPDSVPAALTRGASIGRYIVLAMVGRGGMGEVYAAYDPELDRKVAVKLLRVKPGNGVSLAEGRTRTLREAQAIARLSHPNVVVAYDVGTFEDKVFIAMEYVEGNTVTYWLQVQPRTWREILKVFMDAGRGLAAAHEKGLVHRDFKTDNVMISRDRHVRVMDFGLARQAEKPGSGDSANATAPRKSPTPPRPIPIRILEPSASPDGGPPESPTVVIADASSPPVPLAGHSSSGMFDARLTRTGAMMGTPAYMAPEQFLGTPTDARSDQFSFCIALYEALYGERPFEGSSMTSLTQNVVQGNVRDAPAGSKVPLWVRKVLLRGLRPRSRDRWQSMEELIEALGKDPNVQRRKWAAAAAGVAVIGGLALGGWRLLADERQICSGGPPKLVGIWDLRKLEEPEPARHAQIHKAFLATGKSYAPDVFVTVSRSLTRYAESWANMYKEACEATEVRREQSAEVLDLRMECLQERLGGVRALTDVFSDANGDVVENAVSAANSLESLDRCADVPVLRAVMRPPRDPATKGRVDALRTQLAELRARFQAGRYRDTLKNASALVMDARSVGYQPLLAETLALLGVVLHKSDDIEGSHRAYSEAYFAADASRHDEVRAEVAADLVYVSGYLQGHFEEAHRWGDTADAVLQRLGGHELLRAWLLNDLGAVYYVEGKKDAAVKLLEQSLQAKGKVLGPDHPDVGRSEGNLAITLAEIGRKEAALIHVERSIALLERGLGAAHPELAIQLSNHGEILNALANFQRARQSFERARIIAERELGPDNRSLGDALTGTGLSYLAEGNPSNALVPLERAFRIRQAKETDLSKRAETAFALARALWESNRDRGRARSLAEEARGSFLKLSSKSKASEIETWLRRHGTS
jgi:eukaryotic-like serine/threonine-protein kinase